MAKPIKETPILKGKDAQRFNFNAETVKDRHVDARTKNRIQENYNYLKSITVG
ncbi:hypothetical protein ABWH96_18935 [Marivirga tractuosa]|uniref:hypothetical protein n=1 Tax=Marivirga tractuosa TaxID=1006 RepID=UPI0035D07238